MRSYLFILLCISSFAGAQDISTYTTIKSLGPDWKVYANNQFQAFNHKADDKPRAIYFSIDANQNKGASLRCSANGEFSFFINHQLVLVNSKDVTLLSLDSLSKKYSSVLQCVVFQSKGIDRLITEIVKPTPTGAEPTITRRKADYFFNFSVLASLIVFAYFIVLIRALPRVAANYFNVSRLISLQEREENLVGSRVTSTANILFYLFASLLSGLLLTVIFFYGSANSSLPFFTIDSVWDGFAQWLKWSFIIFLMLVAKLVVIYTLCSLFKITELVSFHFFNFLRLYFVLFSMSALLSLFYFIFKGQNPQFYLYIIYTIVLLASLWLVLIYIKLLAKVPFRFFHLFSYLCVSEIIPMVIIFKILLF